MEEMLNRWSFEFNYLIVGMKIWEQFWDKFRYGKKIFYDKKIKIRLNIPVWKRISKNSFYERMSFVWKISRVNSIEYSKARFIWKKKKKKFQLFFYWISYIYIYFIQPKTFYSNKYWNKMMEKTYNVLQFRKLGVKTWMENPLEIHGLGAL